MKGIKLVLITTLLAVGFSSTLNAQQIGLSWEFNRDGDFEGVVLGQAFRDTSVQNGVLLATATKDFPALSTPSFELQAADYGYVLVRAKMPGATSALVVWLGGSWGWGFSRVTVEPDTGFQVLAFPVYLSANWSGVITRLNRVEFDVPAGTRIAVDYIRIVRMGPKPSVRQFVALRSVVKPYADIPVQAVVKNEGDVRAHLRSELVLPEDVSLLDGALDHDHGEMFGKDADTLRWTLRFSRTGVYHLFLRVRCAEDTAQAELALNVTDRYWKQREFLLSAWSPPYAWMGPPYGDSVFAYYKNANFDQVLWVRDDDALMAKVHAFGFKYFLWTTGIFGNDVVRGPREGPAPPVTDEMLQRLDRLIDKYKDDPDLLGYHICDEPHESAFANIARIVEHIREKDPTRLSFVNIWPNVAPDKGGAPFIEKLLQTTKLELLSYDRYIFFNDHDDMYAYFSNLALIRRYARNYDIPFCNIIQAIGTNGTRMASLNWRTPSPSEHRFLVYTSLAYGVHGLIWFHWHGDWGLTGSPDREKIYRSIQSLSAEIDSLKEVMLHLTTTAVYHTQTEVRAWKLPPDGLVRVVSDGADLVVGLFRNEAGRENTFMLANKSYRDSVAARVTLNCVLDSLAVFDVRDNRWKGVAFANEGETSSFELNLRPGGGKLFRFAGQRTTGVTGKVASPSEFSLEANYPNPFNAGTTIVYRLAREGKVELSVYDLLGRKVRTLVRARKKAGRHVVRFDAGDLPSGVYFYRLRAGDRVQTRKMILLR